MTAKNAIGIGLCPVDHGKRVDEKYEDETGSYTDILSGKRVKGVRQNPRGATFG